MTIDALAAIVGAGNAFGPDAVEPRYLDDETGGVAGRPVGLVRPAGVEQVAAVVEKFGVEWE